MQFKKIIHFEFIKPFILFFKCYEYCFLESLFFYFYVIILRNCLGY